MRCGTPLRKQICARGGSRRRQLFGQLRRRGPGEAFEAHALIEIV